MMREPGSSGDAFGRGDGGLDLEDLVQRAVDGDRLAVDELVKAIQDDVYGLALRMLWHPDDAEDATQEILVKVLTRLGTFQGASKFRTWVYSVASNHLLTTRARRMERRPMSFEEFGEDLESGLTEDPPPGAAVEQRILIDEVKIGCSQGILLCLDRPHRLAYVLGEIVQVTGEEGGEILGTTASAFRKRLERARRALHAFLRSRCGLVDPDNTCRCRRRVRRAIELGRVQRDRLLFADHPERSSTVEARRAMEEVEELRDAVTVMRTNPDYRAPRDFAREVRSLLGDDRFARLVGDP